MTEVLFVCTGNTCRSPMAEGIFNACAAKNGIDAHAFSRGIAAEGGSASGNAVAAAAEYDADISGHISRQLTREDLERADVVYCMSGTHIAAILRAFPEYAEKLAPISEYGIADPYGGDMEEYRKAASQIASAVLMIAADIGGE